MELDKLTQSVRLKTIPYTPRNNPIERSHRSINAMIGKLIDKHSQWSTYLDFICFAYNSTMHKATGFTPNFLHFGRELGNSVDLILRNPADQYESHGEFAAGIIDRMDYAYKLAHEMLQHSATLAKRYYDRKVRPQVFCPGDSVLLYSPRRYSKHYGKWQRLYSEEAEVMTRVNDVTYIVRGLRSRQQKVIHVDKIKLLKRVVAPVI
jgi:hypothetical protein